MNLEMLSKVMKTSQYMNTAKKHFKISHEQVDCLPTPRAIMDGFLGARVTHLPPSPEYDPVVISAYISSVLKQLNCQNAYGLLAGIKQGSGPTVPTLLFGIPPSAVEQVDLPPPPSGLPTLIRPDWILLMTEFRNRWAKTPVSHSTKLTLEAISIGIEGDIESGGSFGGFVKRASTPSAIFGLTAAHCMLGADTGSSVCSPSPLEITSRFTTLLRYTSFCPTINRPRLNQTKDAECKSLIARYHFEENIFGTEYVDPANPFQSRKGVLNGVPVGEVVAYHFGNHEGILYDYDQRLRGLGLPGFGVAKSWDTRLDYCIFSCNPDRYGGNIYEGEAVEETADFYPGAAVEKIGRTTGARTGCVNGYLLQYWNGSESTYEIAISGGDISFADAGDSGGCVFVNTGGVCKAAGMLIGKNWLNDIVFATPLTMILGMAAEFEWA